MGRDKTFDGLKYSLIVLVIIGHFIEPSRYNNQLSCTLYSIIYSFHMPLFIWISGHFYKGRNLREEIHKCIPLLEICFISHIGFAILKDGNLNINNILNFSYTPSWFLLSLVCWRLSSSLLLAKVKKGKLLTISIAFAIITFIFVSKYGGVFSFMRTVQFFPFFIAGYYMNGKIQYLERYSKQFYAAGALALTFIIISSCRFQHLCEFQRDGLIELANHTDISLQEIFAFRYLIVICSALICTAILLLARKIQFSDNFVKFGGETLFIYFWQTILFPIVTKFSPNFTESLIISAVITLIITSLSKNKLLNAVMRPSRLIIYFAKSSNKLWER